MKVFIFTQDRYINVLRDDGIIMMYNNSVDYIEKLKHVDYKAYKQIKPILELDEFGILGGRWREAVYAYYKDNLQCGKRMFNVLLKILKDTRFEELLNKHGYYVNTSILNTKELMCELLVRLREYEETKLSTKEHIVNGHKCNYFIVLATDIIDMMTSDNFRLPHKKIIFTGYPECITGIKSLVSGDYIFIDVDVAGSNSSDDTYTIYIKHKDTFLRAADEYVTYVPLKDTAPKNFYKYATVKLLTYRTIRFIYELKTEYKGM